MKHFDSKFVLPLLYLRRECANRRFVSRSDLPDAQTLVRDVQNVDLDLEMADDAEEKKALEDQKMSKTWRALRLLSKTKLNLFDKVDDGKNLECFIRSNTEPREDVGEGDATKAEDDDGGVEAKHEPEAATRQDGEAMDEGETKQADDAMADSELKPATDAAVAVAS